MDKTNPIGKAVGNQMMVILRLSTPATLEILRPGSCRHRSTVMHAVLINCPGHSSRLLSKNSKDKSFMTEKHDARTEETFLKCLVVGMI